MKKILLLLTSFMFVTPAMANVVVRFDEGAPKDKFTITNTGACVLSGALLRIDLSTSKAGLIFDVTGEGAGVEVFQPFEFTSGSKFVEKTPVVRDGDNSIELSIDSLSKVQDIAFTIDVDDTIGQREITVSNSEIQGAGVVLVVDGKTMQASFTDKSQAEIKIC